jgi:Holliday junction resolvasome RuvABC endonuclease subunit
MKILGIRTASTCVRYAIVEWDGQTASLVNAAEENKLDFPADCAQIPQKLQWLYSELDRIYRMCPDISKVNIKMNEFVREKKTTRPSTHMDGVVMLSAVQKKKAVSILLYANIKRGLGSRTVEMFTETNVGRSDKYWNVQMADAIAAAWAGRNM